MPTQVQSLIDGFPVYEPIVSVPSTGEVVTQNALSDTAVALGRRIEWVKSRAELAYKRSIANEDFIALGATDSVGYVWDERWQDSNVSANFVISNLVAENDSVGGVRFSNSTGSVANGCLRKSNRLCTFDAALRAVARVRFGSTASGMGWEHGFSNNSQAAIASVSGDRHCVSAIYEPSANANFRLRVDDGSATLYYASSIAPALNTWYQLAVEKVAGAWTLYIDGVQQAVASSGAPGGTAFANIFWKVNTPNSGANRTVDADFVSAEINAAGRF